MPHSSESCATCGWWYHNPLSPETTFGFCSVGAMGVPTDDMPLKKRSQKCKQWVSTTNVQPIFSTLLIRNQSPGGCPTCPAAMKIYKSVSCRASTFVGQGIGKKTYRRCNLMTPAMCWYGRRELALQEFRRLNG